MYWLRIVQVFYCLIRVFPVLAQDGNIRYDQPYERKLYAGCANKMKITPACESCKGLKISAKNAEIIKTKEKDNYLIVPNKWGDLGWGYLEPLPVTIQVKYKKGKKLIIDSLEITAEELPRPQLIVLLLPKVGHRLDTNTIEYRLRHLQCLVRIFDEYIRKFLHDDNRLRCERVEIKLLERDKETGKELGEFDYSNQVDIWDTVKNEDFSKFRYIAIRCITYTRMNFKGELIKYNIDTDWGFGDLDKEY